jgi:ATP-binding cassette subfamily B protein
LESEIIDACKRARIYDFIMSLDDKFDTEVGPRGLDLSGGQKQRIALARLFLKNPEIIILDEATSALDNETEGFVQDAIDELKDKTVITIAHRLTTIENCDQIYVLDKNTIAEHGTHKELMELNGKYAEMQTIPARRR